MQSVAATRNTRPSDFGGERPWRTQTLRPYSGSEGPPGFHRWQADRRLGFVAGITGPEPSRSQRPPNWITGRFPWSLRSA